MLKVGETYKTNADAIMPDCRVLPANSKVVIIELGEICRCAADIGTLYIDIDKINKELL